MGIGETSGYDDGIYGDKENIELYYLTPDQNGDDVPLIGTQTPGQS